MFVHGQHVCAYIWVGIWPHHLHTCTFSWLAMYTVLLYHVHVHLYMLLQALPLVVCFPSFITRIAAWWWSGETDPGLTEWPECKWCNMHLLLNILKHVLVFIIHKQLEMGIEHSLCCFLQAMTSLLEEATQPLSDSSYYDTVYSIDTSIQVYRNLTLCM